MLGAVGRQSLRHAVGWHRLLRTAFRRSLLQDMAREVLLWAWLQGVRPEVLGSCLPERWAALWALRPPWT